MSSLNTDILRTIECPSCLDYMRVHIYICATGHSICEQCCNRLRRCPQCQSRILNSRNYALEGVAELLSYPCPNAANGCLEFFKKDDLEDHLTTCSYRLYLCQLSNEQVRCDWTGKRTELGEHALKLHEENAWMQAESTDCWQSTESDYHVQMIFAFDEIFYLHRKLVEGSVGSIMYWAVQYVGKSEDAIQYGYEIAIFSDEYVHRDICTREICHDDLKTIDEIIESGICVAVPLTLLETYKNKSEEVCYNIKIEML